jgi:energy-coupling factor transporter ATP-binding protein EcfA2
MEKAVDIFINGSVWLRADFHLHTNADKEFAYSGAPNDFIRQYVDQLAAQSIGLGVITNHNKFDREQFVALRKAARKQQIGLLPGIEFSLKEGIHVLIVFDDPWFQGNTDNINAFLATAFYGKPNFSVPPYPNSQFDLGETVLSLDQIGYDYFIVLAHPDDTNGLFEVLSGRTKEDFIRHEAFSKVLAVQKSGSMENYQALCKLADRQIACVEGSDHAQGGIAAIGQGRKSYIKLGDFSFEAVKYALVDHAYRVKKATPPEISNAYIKSIRFEGGLLSGKEISFSPELNTLIGIRGSGKSSILEILRYALDIPLSTQTMDRQYKSDLIQFVLKSGGKVVIQLVNGNNEDYRVEKIYGQKEDIYKDNILQQGITLAACFKSPVYFGQKDLSNKDIDFEAHLIHSLIGTRLQDVQQQLKVKKAEVDVTIGEIKKLQNLVELKRETETIIANARHQLELFKQKGVEEKLRQQTLFDRDVSTLSGLVSLIAEYMSTLGELIRNYAGVTSPSMEGSEYNKDFFDTAAQLVSELREQFSDLNKVYQRSLDIQKRMRELADSLLKKKEGLKEEFARIKREINQPTLNPDNFLVLNRQVETAQLKLNEIQKSEVRRADLHRALGEQLVQYNDLMLREFRLIEAEVSRINGAENKLKIEVVFKGRKDKFLAKMQQVFRGTNIRTTSYEAITEKFPDFIEIYRNSDGLADILADGHVTEFKRRFWDNAPDLLTFQTENSFVIRYNGKPLKDHSLGQRASALILFLLAQKENDVLVIDQPEDDLDNQTIYEEVIKEIKRLKGQMQFIFATHNANIPVLGDSEKVIACTYIDNKEIMIQAGTIDTHETQEQIVSIMEGGKEAFSRRKDIYDIWKIEK